MKPSRIPSRAVDPALMLQDIRERLPSDPSGAVSAARSAVRQYPEMSAARRLLARALRAMGNETEAEKVELDAIRIALAHPAMVEAQRFLDNGRVEDAEQAVRPWLRENPDDAGGALLLGTIAERCEAVKEAENLYRRAVLLAPAYAEARVSLAKLFNLTGRHDEALAELDAALSRDPKHLIALAFKAGLLVQLRRLDEADTVFKRMLRAHPDDGRGWMNYAHLAKTQGRIEDAIQAYRNSVAANPSSGIAWWGLANLKSVKLTQDDIGVMQAALESAEATDDRLHLNFALGKALGDLKEYERSFDHYRQGNRLRLDQVPHDPGKVTRNVDTVTERLTPDFFAARSGQGYPAPDPIFIVSMPRSGSTLIEQILASHSMVEGTEELYDLERIALDLAPGEPAGSYLNRIGDLTASQLRDLGRHYIDATRRHRRTDRPFFTDKMPSNWVFTGLIHLILPNAKIVDVRRHPMACGFANFAQHYNWGLNFAYDLTHIGSFYRDYVRQMAHFDQVAPALVHRVIHEELVGDLEGEVRRLLDYLGLPFEDGCLRFHETDRAVHTPSSEQVRQPVNRRGFDTWRNYEPWLGSLKDSLGEALDNYSAPAARN
jgi:tetratricopeptide (TPR) repeat protein